MIILEETNERGLRTIIFDEELLGIMTTFPLGTRTAPLSPVVADDVVLVVYSAVVGLKNPMTAPEAGVVVGTKKIRPSGKSRLPQKERVPGVEATFPKTGVDEVAHHEREGWLEALHVEEIQAWIMGPLAPLGVRYGPRLVISSP